MNRAAEARRTMAPTAAARRAGSNSHDTDAMASSVLSSIDPDIVKTDAIDTDDLVDDVPAGKTLPSPGSIGSPAAAPIAQFDGEHEIMTAMTVHITSMNVKVQSRRPAPAARC